MSNPAQKKPAEEARAHLPSLLDAAEEGRATIITRRGKPVAALIPIADYAPETRQLSLLPLEGTGKGLWGEDSRQTIRELKDEWDRF